MIYFKMLILLFIVSCSHRSDRKLAGVEKYQIEHKGEIHRFETEEDLDKYKRDISEKRKPRCRKMARHLVCREF